MTERTLITISSRELKFSNPKEQEIYENAAKNLVESNYKNWVTTSKEVYDWKALVDSIKEGWDPYKVGINYRTLDTEERYLTLQPYEVVRWTDRDGRIFYKPLTVHRTIALFTLPEMTIDVVLVG